MLDCIYFWDIISSESIWVRLLNVLNIFGVAF